MANNVKFVYFDLGNVLVHFDHEIGMKALATDAGHSPEFWRREIFDSDLQNRLESGQLDSLQFAQVIIEKARHPISPDRICYHLSNIFCLNRPMIPIVFHLRQQSFPIGILSNTCQPHWEFVMQNFSVLDQLFDSRHRILSYKAESMKPDAKIFEVATSCTGFEPNEILFLDDRIENVEGARQFGLNAIHFQDHLQFAKAAQEYSLDIYL